VFPRLHVIQWDEASRFVQVDVGVKLLREVHFGTMRQLLCVGFVQDANVSMVSARGNYGLKQIGGKEKKKESVK